VPWQDRIREGAYTPPSGIRLTFQFEDVSRETDKRVALFRFPKVNGGYGQDNGFGERRYPLRCFFTGPSCDLAATAFEIALLETGEGRLEHPLYGAFDALPYGTITRRDDLKTAANQSIVEVTFVATLGVLYPSGQTSPRDELLAALDAYDAAAADQFVEMADLRTAAARAAMQTSTKSYLRTAVSALSAAADSVTAVSRAFRDQQAAINDGLTVLVGQPLQLARQVLNLVKAPAIALTGLEMRVAGYRTMAEKIFGSTAVSAVQSAGLAQLQLRLTNNFQMADLYASAAVAGSLRSCVANTFQSKPEALAAALEALAQYDNWINWHDDSFGALGQFDPGGSHQALQHAAAAGAGYLVAESFSLVTERRLVIDRARTIIDVAAELYGSVDDKLDYLISTNGFTGAQILELERGTSVAYYR
jgi:prophage DNA circulation protein